MIIIIENALTANIRNYFRIFRERNINKENSYDGVRFLILLLMAECNFTKKKFLLQTFSNNPPRLTTNEHYNNLFCKASQNSFSETLYQPLKFHPSRRLVPVHGCNLTLSPDNCKGIFLLYFRYF